MAHVTNLLPLNNRFSATNESLSCINKWHRAEGSYQGNSWKISKTVFRGRCIAGGSPFRENAIETKEEYKKSPQAYEFIEFKRQIDSLRAKLQSIGDGELSISAYDTAWVSLVNDINLTGTPMFPTCLEWIINNQLPDGSWGDRQYFNAYDRLSCTLASVVALKKWNVYPEGCEKGLSFLLENLGKFLNEDPEHQLSGFEVTFTSTLELAQTLNLEGLKDCVVLQDLYRKREVKLRRIPKEILHNVPTTLLHSLEGVPDLDWQKLLKLQHPNGSFLCSPSSTAYAFMNTADEKCFNYLRETVAKFNGGVPHSYPMDLFERLWVVDRLERLGVSRYFKSEIKECLDHVYRFWTPNGISWSRDTVELDIDDTSMGFRILRLHGYNVTADVFTHFEREGQFFCFVGQTSQGITEMLSLLRASRVLFPGEKILEEAKEFSFGFLKKKQELGHFVDRWIITKNLPEEVCYYLDVPWYASLPRIETRNYTDIYGGSDDVWIAKVLYRMYNISNNSYLDLAKLDYNYCQRLHLLEWTNLKMWCNELNLGDFGITEYSLLKVYFVAMSSIFEPEQGVERFAWAQTQIMIQAVTFFFNSISTQEKKDFIEAFCHASPQSRNSDNSWRNQLLEAILQTLSDIAENVIRVQGEELCTSLKHCWNTWLLTLAEKEEVKLVLDNEAELIVLTINLCAGHISLMSLTSTPEYLKLARLTNEICNDLHQIEGKTGVEETNLDLKMQELLQHVTNCDKEMDREMRLTFLTVAKSYYYNAYSSPATIDRDITKVLFEKLV